MRTRRRVVFSKLTAPEVLLAFPVPIVPPRPPAPPAPPVPAEAPPLFSLLGGVDDATTTPPPVPPMPPVLPCASLSPVRARARVSFKMWFWVGASRSLSTVTSIVKLLMSSGQSQPNSTSKSVPLRPFSLPASDVALPVCTSPPAPPLPPLPPLPAEAPPLFSLPLPPSTPPPLPPAPPVLPCASLSPVCERAEVSLLIEPRRC